MPRHEDNIAVRRYCRARTRSYGARIVWQLPDTAGRELVSNFQELRCDENPHGARTTEQLSKAVMREHDLTEREQRAVPRNR
jgi:hypothetical protein